MKSRYKRIVVDGKCMLEHRTIVEKALGRKLLPNEQVHHINCDRYDNRIENLQVVTQAEHDLIHKWKHPNKKECAICGKEFMPCASKRKTAKVCSKECKLVLDKQNAQKRKRPINQYTLTGRLVKTWSSARDVQNELGYHESNICRCCKKRISKAYGYIWRYFDEDI